MTLSRRQTLIAGLAAALPVSASAPVEARLHALETQHGGRLGVYLLDTDSGRSAGIRSDERFLTCSTIKALLVAAMLHQIERGRETLDAAVHYTEKDLLEYAPVASAHVHSGALTIRELCAASVEVSDNTAANLLFTRLGGPQALTTYIRLLGDTVTRSDRIETALNEPNGVFDTTSPRAMAHSVAEIAFGDALQPASQLLLQGWMRASTPGLARLRAGLPESWHAGDKSGTYGAMTNDVAIATPPGRAPIVVAAYYEAPDLGRAGAARVLADVGRIASSWAIA